MTYYPTDSNGRFVIPMRPGQFSLYPCSLTHKFNPIRVEVGADLDVTLYQIVPGVEYDTAVPIQTSSGVFRWYSIGENDYYTAKAGFALTGLLLNPMFLLMGFSMLLMFAMPKLMENMEEMVKEEKQAAAVTAPAQNKARATPKK
ncbi:hypothetical protein MP638_005744 [Amoeboaphelidium occidentale]|nr:hypothetical protein MP638_005744 [Amoeboaphelidium occidentale]